MEVHACIGRYKRSNCSNIKGNNIWTSTSPCEQIIKIIRISSMALLQYKGGFPDPGLMCAYHDRI